MHACFTLLNCLRAYVLLNKATGNVVLGVMFGHAGLRNRIETTKYKFEK